MDFSLTAEQRMMVDTARQIGERHGLDYWREKDKQKAFPAEIWQAICDAGLCGIMLPEEHMPAVTPAPVNTPLPPPPAADPPLPPPGA